MESVDRKIRRLISYYSRLCGSRDPVAIANYAGIGIHICPLGEIAGNYKLLKRKRWIFVNENMEPGSPMFNVVVAHELGHALLHRKENCAFIKRHTLLLTSGIEREANLFAAQLLIDDALLMEYKGMTEEQFCNGTGYPKELIRLRID